jgi:6-pyruvoyl-tetrahydropterin synthase-like protein
MKGQAIGNKEQGTGFALGLWQPDNRRQLIGLVVIMVAALVATGPQLFLGNSCGHDFDFHLVSWLDAQQSWREGIVYPHWSPSANFGAGEPRFIFYPPLTWMLGAALGLMMRWKMVPIAITFLCLAGTGLATRALARQQLSEGPATLAGCAALFSGYALFTAYERSDFGELAGGFWIPLLLLFILQDRMANTPGWQRALDGSAAPLALVVAGAWLSNAPLGVMACYLLAAMALALAVLRRSGAPLARAIVAAAIGIGLAAFYIVPAAVEQRWVDIRQAIDDPGYQVENSWLFARHTNPALELHDLELEKVSGIATTMLAVAVSGMLVCWARHQLRGKTRWWIPLALIPMAVLFLQFPISDPVWRLLPKLRFLQFPWRWLVIAEAPMGIFFASAIWISRGVGRIAMLGVCIAVFLAATSLAGFSFFQDCDEQDAIAGMLSVYRAGTGFEGVDEYAPTHADNSLLAMGLPVACLSPTATTSLGQASAGGELEWSPDQGGCEKTFPAAALRGKPAAEHLRVDADVPYDGYLILRMRRYPAWQVRVNGRLAAPQPERADGLIAVSIPQGRENVTVDWTATEDTWIGRCLSALALLVLIGLWWTERKLAPSRLS